MGRRNEYDGKRGEVLVAIMNSLADWEILTNELWYRIPVNSAPMPWPPAWMAFYHTKVFGEAAFAVRFAGEVSRTEIASRRELFPDETPNAKSDRVYHQIFLESIEELPEPIVSFRNRRIVFIPTTLYRLETAVEINDLYHESPLEEAVWKEMKRLEIRAERQFFVEYEGQFFALDFAVFCRDGKIDIETDGDKWHSTPERVEKDNRRNNAMAALGYKVLRFNTQQVRESLTDYCVPQIVKTVTALGGPEDSPVPGADYRVTKRGEIARQFKLFEGHGDDPEAEDSPDANPPNPS